MKLYSRILGNGPPVLILHGLFGMSDNWMAIGRALAARNHAVHLPDLRNHGRSPHDPSHRYPDMCDDLIEYLEGNSLDTVHIIGHSMGGKLAMIFSLLYPERVGKLVVVDIAPSDYRPAGHTTHSALIDTLMEMDLAAYKDRGSARQELERRLHDLRLAMFLTKNLHRDERTKKLAWRLNLPAIRKHLHHLYIGLEELDLYAPCPVDTLFIKGNDSHYYQEKHEPDRLHFFPHSRVVGIDGAGHWVHSEQSELFLSITADFLSGREGRQ